MYRFDTKYYVYYFINLFNCLIGDNDNGTITTEIPSTTTKIPTTSRSEGELI